MAFQITMGMTYAGREPEVLNDLILRRQRLFGETAQAAVIGTAIGVMQSLRTQTIVADETKISFVRSASARVSWTTVNKRRSMKVEGWGEFHKSINLTGRYRRGMQASAYVAKILKNGEEESIFLIAEHDSQVADYLKKRIKRYKGMARSAWGHLMRMTSQRTPASEPVSAAAVNVMRKNLDVVSGGNQYNFAIQITDGLQYAAASLKLGPASVSHALQAESNKIAGRIRKFCQDHPSFSGESIQTPFPEIKTRKD
jgi:hypothetical protein